jgi:hypothetical protein
MKSDRKRNVFPEFDGELSVDTIGIAPVAFNDLANIIHLCVSFSTGELRLPLPPN